jgi:predicted PurR-regulated permease PerM
MMPTTRPPSSTTTLGTTAALAPRFKVIKSNIALAMVLLFLWACYQGFKGLFNEVLLIFGAYTFSFFILTWALHLQNLFNLCVGWLFKHLFKRSSFALPRSVSIFLAYGVLSAIVVLIVAYAVPVLSQQFQAVFEIVKSSFHQVEANLALWESGKVLPQEPAVFSANISPSVVPILPDLRQLQGVVAKQLLQLASSSFTPLFYVFIGQIITFYLLLDGDKLNRFVVEILPKVRHSKWGKALAFSQILMFRTVKAYTLSALLSGFFFWVLCHAIDIPFAGVLAWCFGVFSFVPVLGPWLGVVPASVVLLAQGAEDKLFFLALGVSLFGYLRAKYVSPQLFDKRYRFHPIWLIVLWYGCFQLAGILGVFLFIPLTVFLAMVGRFLLPKSIEKVT